MLGQQRPLGLCDGLGGHPDDSVYEVTAWAQHRAKGRAGTGTGQEQGPVLPVLRSPGRPSAVIPGGQCTGHLGEVPELRAGGEDSSQEGFQEEAFPDGGWD